MRVGGRASAGAFLDHPVEDLRYIQGSRAQALSRLGIFTVRDLIENYPRRYLDMSTVTTVVDAAIGSQVTVVGTVGEVNVKQPRPRMNIVEVSVIDATGVLFGTWFGQPWMAHKVRPGDRVSVAGKVEFNYGFKRMNTPFLEVLDSASDVTGDEASTAGRVVALHHLTADLSASWMRRLISTALDEAGDAPDPLPPALRIRHGLVDRASAWRGVHFPSTMGEAERSHRRLAYEELLMLQLRLMLRRAVEEGDAGGHALACHGGRYDALRSALGFRLTSGQEEALGDILDDMARPTCMDRMLLGDVGTGKTAVAALAMAVCVDSGFQAAMMAPTTVLATQYATKLGPLMDASGVRWGLLTGATPAARRREILDALVAGEVDIIMGTHALIQEDVVFARLGLVIIDEQHRFGVAQRAALRAKGPGSDLLVMTATPIPRTLALVAYGDLECSYLRQKPVAHAPVSTILIAPRERVKAYEAIRHEVAAGHRAYIICPLVGVDIDRVDDERRGQLLGSLRDGEDAVEQKAATDQADFLARKVFPRLHVGLLTGRMASAEKNRVMADFATGRIDVLVSTTVVEVGVDVPAATVMMVENADCFGLSQLHQLRGRVGRGEAPGTMFLVAKPRSDEAKARLAALVATDDGFELAEYDLHLRHEGDILGSRQSGVPGLKVADIVGDADLVEMAHEDAGGLLRDDPGLRLDRHALLAHEVDARFADGEVEGA